MKYIKKETTNFDAHGHWNTNHTISISLNDACALMQLLDKQYPEAFTHEKGTGWVFGKVIYDKIPDTCLQAIVKTLETVLNSEP